VHVGDVRDGLSEGIIEPCRLFSEMDPIDFSSIRETETNRRTSTLNATIAKRSSGSFLFGLSEVEGFPAKKSTRSRQLSWGASKSCWTDGMSISTAESRSTTASNVSVTDDTLLVELSDGRTLLVPLAWYPRLLHAKTEERNRWRLIGQGVGLHWEDLDEDISVKNLLDGQPSGESQSSFQKWLDCRGGGRG